MLIAFLLEMIQFEFSQAIWLFVVFFWGGVEDLYTNNQGTGA